MMHGLANVKNTLIKLQSKIPLKILANIRAEQFVLFAGPHARLHSISETKN
jgi:hypothetical protein